MTPRWICLAAVVLSGLTSVSARAATIQVTIDKLVYSPAEVTAKGRGHCRMDQQGHSGAYRHCHERRLECCYCAEADGTPSG